MVQYMKYLERVMAKTGYIPFDKKYEFVEKGSVGYKLPVGVFFRVCTLFWQSSERHTFFVLHYLKIIP